MQLGWLVLTEVEIQAMTQGLIHVPRCKPSFAIFIVLCSFCKEPHPKTCYIISTFLIIKGFFWTEVQAALTHIQEAANFEVGNCQSHDGCLIQLGYSALRHGQSFRQICEDLRLPTSTASSCITWLLFAFLRVSERTKEIHICKIRCLHGHTC